MKNAVLWIHTWLALSAYPALAVDGVREINQICAESTGCFAGDTAGFPVTITAPGSYRLTSNLLVSSASTDAIAVASARVSIDLNGFSISGVTSCTFPPLACAPAGSGRGIAVTGPGVAGLAVRNGSVAGMGNAGVYVGNGGRVEDVRAIGNGGPGIRTEQYGHVLRCTATENGGPGILTSFGAVVDGNIVRVSGAGAAGIEGDTSMLVQGNQVRQAGDDGILVGSGSLISGNDVSSVGGDGIEVGIFSRVERNVVTAASVYGLHFAGTGSYADNMIFSSGPAHVFGPGIDMGGNLCEASACP